MMQMIDRSHFVWTIPLNQGLGRRVELGIVRRGYSQSQYKNTHKHYLGCQGYCKYFLLWNMRYRYEQNSLSVFKTPINTLN